MLGLLRRCILRLGGYAGALQEEENDQAEPHKHDGLDSKSNYLDAKFLSCWETRPLEGGGLTKAAFHHFASLTRVPRSRISPPRTLANSTALHR